jgi:hypothetical protein
MDQLLELKKYTMLDMIKETPCYYFIHTKIPLKEGDSKGNIYSYHLIFKINKNKLNLKKNYWNPTFDKSCSSYRYDLKYRCVITRNNYSSVLSRQVKEQNIVLYLKEYFEDIEDKLESFL